MPENAIGCLRILYSVPQGQEEARGSESFAKTLKATRVPIMYEYVIAGSSGFRTWPRGSRASHPCMAIIGYILGLMACEDITAFAIYLGKALPRLS